MGFICIKYLNTTFVQCNFTCWIEVAYFGKHFSNRGYCNSSLAQGSIDKHIKVMPVVFTAFAVIDNELQTMSGTSLCAVNRMHK